MGYKVWVLAEESGYVIQFDPYQGRKYCGSYTAKIKRRTIPAMICSASVEKSRRLSLKSSRNSSRTSNRTNTISRNVCNEIRYDQMGHFSEPCATTKRCALCKKTRVDGVRSVERALMIAALIIAFMAFRLGAFSFDIFVRSKSGCRFEQQVDF